jgi:hypothetical protein
MADDRHRRCRTAGHRRTLANRGPAVLRVADRFRRDRDEAARAALTTPTARLSTALIAASLIDNQELRSAAHNLREAVASLLPSIGTEAKWSRELDNLNGQIRNFRNAVDRALVEPERLAAIRHTLGRRKHRRSTSA